MYYIMTQTHTHMHKCTLTMMDIIIQAHIDTHIHTLRHADTCTDR